MSDNYLLLLPVESHMHCRVHVNTKNSKDLKELIKKKLDNGPIINLTVQNGNSHLAAFCGVQFQSKKQNLLAKKFINPNVTIFGDVILVGKERDSQLRPLSDIKGECDLI